MAFEAATAGLCRLVFGQGGEIEQTNWAGGSRSSARSSWMRASPPRLVVFHTAKPGREVPNSS